MAKAAAAQAATWAHPEYGTFLLRPAYNAMDDFEKLYEDRLYALVTRKWPMFCMGWPLPRFRRLELVGPDGEDGGFAPVQGAILDIPKKAGKAPDLSRIQESLGKNGCACLMLEGGSQMAISPFFEWELADFWEEGRYDED